MKLEKIYRLAVEMGIRKDPRGKAGIADLLADAGDEYARMKKDEKAFFDRERLVNPFADTRILYGNENIEVERVFAGVDVETPELLLVDRLRSRGMKIDLAIAHHPEGRGLVGLSDVMSVQADVWAAHGVPVNIGDALIGERMKEIWRAILPQNHRRPVDAARLLDIPFMCVHTPADNLVTDHLSRVFKREKPRLVKDVLDLLLKQEEYRRSARNGVSPAVLVGDGKARAGEILVDMTGGTEGPASALEKLAAAGVGTVVCMHMGDKIKAEAEKNHINVIIAGHIASDSIGLNLFFDALEKQGVACEGFSGFERFSRLRK